MIAVQRELVDNVQAFRFPELEVFIQATGDAGEVSQLDARVPACLFTTRFDDADWSSVNQAGFSLEVLQRQAA